MNAQLEWGAVETAAQCGILTYRLRPGNDLKSYWQKMDEDGSMWKK